jgi:hypothetical protein
MNLESELAKALRQKRAPSGIADRVFDRIAQGGRSDQQGRRWTGGAALRMAAALFVVALIGAGAMRQLEMQRERQEGERAKQQLMTALRIASEALNDAQTLVHKGSR